jgi:hypothetical protein
MKCVSPARQDCAAAAWDILCERLDCRSFARSLSLLENLMVRQRSSQSLSDYVHSMRQTFDDYDETCQMVDGSAAIHPHSLGLLMLRCISSSGPHGQAKQCVINAFDTDYLLPADEVMANILHLAHNMDNDPAPDTPAPVASPPPISAFVAAGRGSHSGRGQPHRHPRGSRPNKCGVCGSLNHLISACPASDDAILKWNLAKRKMTVQKHGAPGGTTSAHAAMLSDVPADDAPADDTDSLPTLEDCANDYDDDEVSVPFSSVTFSSSHAPGRNLSQFWVVDSACSINLTAFRDDFVKFRPPSAPPRVGIVGVDVKGSGSLRISVRLASGQLIHSIVHALYTPDLSSRSAQRIGGLLSVSWMQTHSGCEFIFPSNFDNGLLLVPTCMGVLEPSGNGLYLLPHQPELPSSPSAMSAPDPLTSSCPYCPV